MDTDIRDEIERSFGDGPPGDDLTVLLDRGRRSLRRRRLAEGGSMLVAGLAVVAVAALTTGGTTDEATPPPAAPPTSKAADPGPTVPDPAPDVVALVDDPALSEGVVADLLPDGLHVKPGLDVRRTVQNPYDLLAPERSIAIAYVVDGTTFWFAGTIETGSTGSAVQPAMSSMSFRDWVEAQRPISGSSEAGETGSDGGGPWPGVPDLDLVRFVGDTEALRPSHDVAIFEQRPHPTLPDSFAGGDDQTAVADVGFQGKRYFVLARRSADGGPAQYIAVPR